MSWFDQISLPATIVLPLIGALFLLFIPEHEFALRKRVALLIVISTGIFHLRNSILFFRMQNPSFNIEMLAPLSLNEHLVLTLDKPAFLGISFVLVALFMLLYCSLSKNIQSMQLNSKILFLLSITCATMLISNFGVFVLGQFFIVQAILAFNLRDGGSHRSSSSLAASISFFILDLTAFFVWRWRADLLFDSAIYTLLIFLPMISRLVVPFFSPWARLFFANSTIEISILYLSTSFIPATVALARYHPDLAFLAPIATAAGIFAALLALGDKHLAQFLIRLISAAGALVLYLFSSPLSSDAENQVLAYCGTLTLLVCLGLLIQRTMSEDIPQNLERNLRPVWYTTLMLLSGVPFIGVGAFVWQIFPSGSALWLLIFGMLAFAMHSRVRESPAAKLPKSNLTFLTSYSPSTIPNLWACVSLIVLMTFSLQLIFSQAVLPT